MISARPVLNRLLNRFRNETVKDEERDRLDTKSHKSRRWLLVPVLAVAVIFLPFIFKGEHIVPFSFEWGMYTGIPGGGIASDIASGLPHSDNSAIFLHYPNAAFSAESLRSGKLPLWNPYVGCGTPGLGSGQVYPFSPFLIPFDIHPSPWTYTFGLLLGCIWGALGIYLWLGRMELDHGPRAFGAALWICNPHFPQWVVYTAPWGEWWFGWLLWSWDMALRKRARYWWLPAVMITGMVYCGHPETAVLLSGASILYLVISWRCRSIDERISGRTLLRRFTGIFLLAGSMTAVHWLPVLAHLAESISYKGTGYGHAFQRPYPLGAFFSPTTEIYLSPVLIALLFTGLFAIRKKPRLIFAIALIILAILMGGCLSSLAFISKILTLEGSVRTAYAWPLLWNGVVPLAAAGVDVLHRQNVGKRLLPLTSPIVGFLPFSIYLVVLALMGNKLYRLVSFQWTGFYLIVSALLVSIAFATRKTFRSALITCIALAICLDPFVHHGFGYRYFNREDPSHVPVIGQVKQQLDSSHSRMAAPIINGRAEMACLSPNLASLWCVRDPRIIDVLLCRRFVELHDSLYGLGRRRFGTAVTFPGAGSKTLGLLGVGYAVVPLDKNGEGFRWVDVPGALPRAFISHRAVPSSNEQESIALWKNEAIRAGSGDKPIVEGWAGPRIIGISAQADDRVAWLEDAPSSVRLSVMSSTGGVLVLLDTYARGWHARIDGKAVRIYPVNLAFRGVMISPGSHVVSFTYLPVSVGTGICLSIIGWLCIIGFMIYMGYPYKKEDQNE